MKLLFALLLLVSTALAEGPGDDARSLWSSYELEQLGEPGTPPATEAELDATTEEIAGGLRCPVCQGMPVSESPAETAITWKNAVRDLTAMGYSRDQIEAFFVRRHGEWVLLAPPAHGLNWLLWLAPAFILGIGIPMLGLWAAASRDAKRSDAPQDPVTATHAKDPYELALLSEIED